MSRSIIELTQKKKREAFSKLLSDEGKNVLVVVGDLIPFIPLGSLVSVASGGIATFQDYLFCKKIAGFLEKVESAGVTDEQIEAQQLQVASSRGYLKADTLRSSNKIYISAQPPISEHRGRAHYIRGQKAQPVLQNET